jgi:hypothetical protein
MFTELDYNRIMTLEEDKLVAWNQDLGREVDKIQSFRRAIVRTIADRQLRNEHERYKHQMFGKKAKDAVAEGTVFTVGVSPPK